MLAVIYQHQQQRIPQCTGDVVAKTEVPVKLLPDGKPLDILLPLAIADPTFGTFSPHPVTPSPRRNSAASPRPYSNKSSFRLTVDRNAKLTHSTPATPTLVSPVTGSFRMPSPTSAGSQRSSREPSVLDLQPRLRVQLACKGAGVSAVDVLHGPRLHMWVLEGCGVPTTAGLKPLLKLQLGSGVAIWGSQRLRDQRGELRKAAGVLHGHGLDQGQVHGSE